MNMAPHTDRSLRYRAPASPPAPRRLLILSHGVGGNETNLESLAARVPADGASRTRPTECTATDPRP